MTRLTSSGDMLADRRFAYAEALLAEGDTEAAADLLKQVLERTPHWVPALMALGAAEEKRGDPAKAIAAYTRAVENDATGLFGAALHKARLDTATGATVMPAAYVAALFDDYAPRFDRHLVEALHYRGPELLLQALAAAGAPARFGHVFDLGCGTGLMGRAVRTRSDRLDGVDLSPRMIDAARQSDVYDTLHVGDIFAHLSSHPPGMLDLVLAADVFVYLGALEPVLAAVARSLRPGGLIAFTVQRSDDDSPRLGADLRFAHSAAYLHGALRDAGYDVLGLAPASTRRDAGQDVPGLVVVAQKP